MATHQKIIDGLKYTCRTIPITKQLSLLGKFPKIEEGENQEGNFELLEAFSEGLLLDILTYAKVTCERVRVGDSYQEDIEVAPFLDDHFEDLEILMEVVGWVMDVSFKGKKKKEGK